LIDLAEPRRKMTGTTGVWRLEPPTGSFVTSIDDLQAAVCQTTTVYDTSR